jgi:hypothetical protein
MAKGRRGIGRRVRVRVVAGNRRATLLRRLLRVMGPVCSWVAGGEGLELDGFSWVDGARADGGVSLIGDMGPDGVLSNRRRELVE